jgi:hypothetical protein
MSEKKIDIINPDFYYGTRLPISGENDISYLHRGGVYYLKDKKDENTFHPYVVISKKYLDKHPFVEVFGLTSTPATIDMIPIIIDSAIAYINPHSPPYIYPVDLFSRGNPDCRYIGDIVNSKAFKLALEFYMDALGVLEKSEEELYIEYYEYVDSFEKRSIGFKPVRHKADNGADRVLTIKFTTSRDIVHKTIESNNDVEPTIVETKEETDSSVEKPKRKYTTKRTKTTKTTKKVKEPDDKPRSTIIVDTCSQAIQSAVATMENQTNGALKIPSKISDMTNDDIQLFLAYLKFNSQNKAAKLYGCAQSRIANKKKAIESTYDIVYK